MSIPQRMHAAIFAGEGLLSVVERDVPSPKAHDDVLVKVEACGVCGTDLRFLSVPPILEARHGVVLGHEYVGEIVSLGAGVQHLALGDRVVAMPDIPCGYCDACLEGYPNLCPNVVSIGGAIDGGFAEYAMAPARALYPIPKSLTAEAAGLFELQTCVLGGVEKAALLSGEDVVVIGAGPAGLSYMKWFNAAGAGRVIMVEINPWRINFALHHGATVVLNPQCDDVVQSVRQLTGGGASIVVDALGSALDVAIRCAGRAARIIVFGENAQAECAVRPYDIQQRELRILGSYLGPCHFPKVVRALEHGSVDLTDLVTHRLSLSELPAGIKELAAGRGAKGICFLERR